MKDNGQIDLNEDEEKWLDQAEKTRDIGNSIIDSIDSKDPDKEERVRLMSSILSNEPTSKE